MSVCSHRSPSSHRDHIAGPDGCLCQDSQSTRHNAHKAACPIHDARRCAGASQRPARNLYRSASGIILRQFNVLPAITAPTLPEILAGALVIRLLFQLAGAVAVVVPNPLLEIPDENLIGILNHSAHGRPPSPSRNGGAAPPPDAPRQTARPASGSRSPGWHSPNRCRRTWDTCPAGAC